MNLKSVLKPNFLKYNNYLLNKKVLLLIITAVTLSGLLTTSFLIGQQTIIRSKASTADDQVIVYRWNCKLRWFEKKNCKGQAYNAPNDHTVYINTPMNPNGKFCHNTDNFSGIKSDNLRNCIKEECVENCHISPTQPLLPTPTLTPTLTPTRTPTPIPTRTPTPTNVPPGVNTPTPTRVPTLTPTYIPTNVPTSTPQPSNLGCGQTCTSAYQCSSGMSCIDIGGGSSLECWNGDICGGGPDTMIRISGRVVNCSNAGVAGVKVKAFSNTVTTDQYGYWYLTKGGTYYGSTSILTGADAGSTNYYTRVNQPTFNRGFTCADISCNYRPPSPTTPYREAYYIYYGGTTGFTDLEFNTFLKTSSNTEWVTGFNYKTTGCN